MKLKIRKRRGFTLVELLVVVAIMLSLAGIAYPVITSQIRKADLVKMVSSSKDIMTAMNNFSRTFNSYPDDQTAAVIEESTTYLKVEGMTLYGETSNPYYRQLLASEYMDSEAPFYVNLTSKTLGRTVQPDNKIANGLGLSRGECAFGYVMYDRGEQSMGIAPAASKSATPVMVSLPTNTGNAGTMSYDVDAFGEQVFVMRVNNSSEFLPIDINGNTDKVFDEDNRGRATAQDFKVYMPEL